MPARLLGTRGPPASGRARARGVARRNLLVSVAGAGAVVRGVDGVERGGRAAAARRLPLHAPTSCSGSRRCPGSPAARCGSSSRSWCRCSAAARGRRCRRCAAGAGDRPRRSRCRTRRPAIRRSCCSRSPPASAAATSPRAWRTSASSIPAERKGAALGWNAGLGNLGVALAQLAVPLVVGVGAVRRARRRAAGLDRRRGRARGLAAERRLRLGAADRRRRGAARGSGWTTSRRCGRRSTTRRWSSCAAHLDPVLALPRHLRLVHRLRRRLSAAGRDASSPASTSTAYAFVGPLLGALARPAGRLAGRPRRRRARRARVLRRDGAASSACSLLSRRRAPGWRRSSRCSRCCSSRAASATAPCSS